MKPASRLSIVFILAVVISVSILTYFSINNISNLKELTEKRILEEEKEFAARFLTALQNEIEEVSADFKDEIHPPSSIKDSLIKTTSRYDFITLPFILKNDGSFQYPNFIGIPKNQPDPKFSNKFKSAFKEGEEAEFAEIDLETAQEYYLSCLSYSIGVNDSLKALNALGRISVKLNNYENALAYYSLIIVDYFNVISGGGLPYVYYAIPQLLNITDPDNCEKILTIIEFCLEKMEMGAIPLNFNTEELLILITKWSQENIFNDRKQLSHISTLVKSIDQQLQFINEYGNELLELEKKGTWDDHQTVGNDFKVLNSFSGRDPQLLLINTNFKVHTGFLIDREKLFDTIIRMDLQSGFEFAYKMEFLSTYNSNTSRHDLIYSSQLNPYFPGYVLQIEPNDENLIKEFIKRRSWIYGIALVLLVFAMFLGVALILRDITREKHVASLRSDFISNVTHELKTPLTSIYMFAESLLLGRVTSTTKKKEYLSIILRESERLKRMINNILEFSKMEKGKPEYHLINSNLAFILNATIHEMDYWFEKEKFDIVSELDENIYAEIDTEKMKQAISNLLSNAIKYSANTKKIFIRLFKRADHICIEIEDRGIGISEDQLPKIFEKFYRIDQKENISGTGLGLTVVKEIIEAHKGKISVSSEFGKGSVFLITLNQQVG
ncbi:MAG: HAMP domain-containing histidine kinase [Bacteroidales bacterium]|nr:HAMP domain-containing histidine kinase [Bacteroidales bacterium]